MVAKVVLCCGAPCRTRDSGAGAGPLAERRNLGCLVRQGRVLSAWGAAVGP